jgi:dihydrofolate synthase/folylpolyglutamate synthase
MKMPHWPIPLGDKPIDLDLSRIKLLLEELGNPQEKLPPIIHVAGTNGKGSTVAFLRAIFQAAGYRVHTYTSPHLVNFNERIGILGCDIEDNFLYEVTEECRLAAEKQGIQVTFFEGTTAVAFLAFSKIQADIIILEVGLGGRLDATNVIDNPAMSIITNISLDHTDFLGDTTLKIAYEKAGIIKPNCPCIIAQQEMQVMDLLQKIAEANNSPCYAFEYDWIIDLDKYECKSRVIPIEKLSLPGIHQYMNAGNAITAAINLKQFNITDEHIAKGLRNAVWPARLQRLNEGAILNMVPESWQIWIDGAHNESGAHVLSVWLEDQPLMPTYMIFGMTKGRNCKIFLEPFVNKIKHLMGVLIEAEPSSYSGEFVSNEAMQMDIDSKAATSIEEAILSIVAMEQLPARILVCGSLYLAGDVLFKNRRA